MSKFDGFSPEVHEWFKALEADNSKEYFVANRTFFEHSIRGEMAALLSELSKKWW